MPIRFIIKAFAILLSIWLVLVWSKNLTHPAWLKEDTESLLAIPAAILWIIGFWEEIENYFRKKFGGETPAPIQVNVHLPAQPEVTTPPPPATKALAETPLVHRDYDSGNRQIQGPDDPILDPLLGKPLHGREAETKALCDLLEQSNAQVQVIHTQVLAEGGVGKTELCKAALRQYLRSHPFKKAWFVNLESASTLGDLWQRIADAIGLDNLRSEAELLAALPEGLYYLDNLESLSQVPNLAKHLRQISLTPGLQMLASSRYEVPGWGKAYELKTLSLPDAIALFREEWQETGAQTITQNAPELEKFVSEELGCLPLAVVLVAALGRYEGTLDAVMRRWQEAGAAAAKRPGAAANERLESLEHSMRLSLQRLEAPARLLWGLAAFFPTGLPLDFMEELLHKTPELREGRNQLLLHRILHRQSAEDHSGRLRLSPPLARFARDCTRLSADSSARVLTAVEGSTRIDHDRQAFDAATIFSHLAPWLKGLGDKASSDREGQAIGRLFEEFSTMEASVLFFSSLPALPEGLLPMLKAWQNFYWRRIFLGKKILDATLACAEKLDVGDHAWVLMFSGDLARLLGENAEARSRFDAALPLYEKVGDDLGKANTLQWLGRLENAEENTATAKANWTNAISLYQKISEPEGEGEAHVSLAHAAHAAGEWATAQEHLRQAQACSVRAGTPLLVGQVEELAGLLAVV